MKTPLVLALACLVACADNAPDVEPTTTSTGDPTSDGTTAPTTSATTSTETSSEVTGDDAPSSSGATTPTGDGSTDDDSTGAATVPEGCFDYPSFVPTEVSFRNDVMPIFVQSCWMCHQDPAPEAGLFLGYGGTTDEEAVAVRNNLLTMTPHQAPDMIFVVPGDPLTSWMMAKAEYDNPGSDCPLIDCPNPGCDWFAPPTEILPTAQLDVFRSWIANGAPDN